MNIYLKPCPFCGGEAVLSSIHIGDGDYRALVTCTRIGLSDGCASVMVERSSKKTAELDAAKKWNTRAERTCRIRGGECDQCGAIIHKHANLYWVPVGEGMRTVEHRDVHFCPNCGAKVVD